MTTTRHLHDEDFYAWTQAQAAALRRLAETRPNVPLDLDMIADEIEDLGMSEHIAVFSFARLIMQHLLLAAYSRGAELQRRHWLDEIDELRSQIEEKLTPSIRPDLKADLHAVYARARRNVARKMRRYGEDAAAAALPAACPYTLDQILGDWEPGVNHESA